MTDTWQIIQCTEDTVPCVVETLEGVGLFSRFGLSVSR
jgi:hypothetical protein